MIITPIFLHFRKYRKLYRTLYLVDGPRFIVFILLTDFHETCDEHCVNWTSRSQCFEVADLGDISMVTVITAGMATALAPSSMKKYVIVIALE